MDDLLDQLLSKMSINDSTGNQKIVVWKYIRFIEWNKINY